MDNWFQREIVLSPRSRGFHLITREVVAQLPELGRFAIGLAHLFIRHTSAALALNENADPTVRADMEAYFNRLALGTWQGIYLCEHRDDGGPRRLVVTLSGQPF